MTTIDRLASALGHLNTFVKPGSDDQPSVAYVAQQLERAIAELTARQNADSQRRTRIPAGSVQPLIDGTSVFMDRTVIAETPAACPECGETTHELIPTVQGRPGSAIGPACFDLFANVADLDDEEPT